MKLDGGHEVAAKAVLLSTGAEYRRLPVDDLEEYEGLSVFYAAGPPEAQICGAQRVALEEAVFATQEWIDRARTETHLLAEFTSKMAGAHSVNNVKTMFEECGQHQIDFIRRDCDRLFNHSRRMVEAVSHLLTRPAADRDPNPTTSDKQ